VTLNQNNLIPSRLLKIINDIDVLIGILEVWLSGAMRYTRTLAEARTIVVVLRLKQQQLHLFAQTFLCGVWDQ